MRILCTAVGARPHLYPLVPLAWALRSAGHDVRLVSTPALAQDLMRTGLAALPLGGPPQHTARFSHELTSLIYGQPGWPVDWALATRQLSAAQQKYLEMLGRSLVRVAEAMVDPLAAFARQWRPQLVVHDAISYAGAVVAAALGVPAVRHLFGTASVPRLELRVADGRPLPEYERLFARFGVDPYARPALTVDPTPPRMRLSRERPDLDMRYVPYNGAGAQPAGLSGSRRRPRVCVTWGHTAAGALGAAAAGVFRDVIVAVAGLPVQIVVVSTEAQVAALGALPGNVRAVTSVPLQLVLPHCDAIVGQGGDGTTLTAATFGLPQLAVTRKPDAELPAGRLAAAGAGIHLRAQELGSGRASRSVLRGSVDALLTDPAYRVAADELRSEIARAPAPAEVVETLTTIDGG